MASPTAWPSSPQRHTLLAALGLLAAVDAAPTLKPNFHLSSLRMMRSFYGRPHVGPYQDTAGQGTIMRWDPASSSSRRSRDIVACDRDCMADSNVLDLNLLTTRLNAAVAAEDYATAAELRDLIQKVTGAGTAGTCLPHRKLVCLMQCPYA
eukprot:542577-Pleurochrysis_carterae.AAC.1